MGLRIKLTLKASQLHHGAFLDSTEFPSLCVQEFDGIEKCRNIPASGDLFNLALFGRKLFKVLECTGVAAEKEHWLDAFHPLSEPKKTLITSRPSCLKWTPVTGLLHAEC